MASHDDERRFTDEEFALILRTASETPGDFHKTPPEPGLTLGEIQEIAAEVGIDPLRISRAAALLPSGRGGLIHRIMGGGPRHRVEHSLEGVVPQPELRRVMDVARRALETQGEAREVLGGLEWRGGTGTSSVVLSVTPGEGETTLHASMDRTEALMGIYGGVGMAGLGAIALPLAKLVFGETDAGIVAALLSGFPPAFLLARAVWRRSARRWRERFLRLVAEMVRVAEGAVEEREEGEGEAGAEDRSRLHPGE